MHVFDIAEHNSHEVSERVNGRRFQSPSQLTLDRATRRRSRRSLFYSFSITVRKDNLMLKKIYECIKHIKIHSPKTVNLLL